MQNDAHKSDLLHVKEAATELDVHPSTVRRAISSGELAAVRMGQNGHLRIYRRDLQAFLVPAEPRP